jgi:hypothetical protein
VAAAVAARQIDLPLLWPRLIRKLVKRHTHQRAPLDQSWVSEAPSTSKPGRDANQGQAEHADQMATGPPALPIGAIDTEQQQSCNNNAIQMLYATSHSSLFLRLL